MQPGALFDDWQDGHEYTGKHSSHGRVTYYQYADEGGSPLFRVVRTDFDEGREKNIVQHRYDSASGAYVGGKGAMAGVRRVLYRLGEVRAAVERGEPVYVTEGEKAADALRDMLGVCATTASGGAGKWLHADAKPPYAESLRGAHVVLLPDADEPGEGHMLTAAAALLGVARSVKTVRLPDLPLRGDAVEWLGAGGTLDELHALENATPPLTRAMLDVAAAEHPTADAKPARHAPYTLRELLERPELLEPPAAVIPDIAYSGRVTLLSAREKAGKSTITGQAAAALSSGGNFLGTTLSAARVLWYGIDEPLGDTVRRFQQYGGDPDALTIQPERPSAEELRAEIEAAGATLVVIDTLAELWSGRIESDRDANAVAGFFRPYVNVARETGAAIVVLHHTTKDGAEYRGSVQLGASVDIVLTLRRPFVATDPSSRGGEIEEEEDDGRRTLRGKGRGVDVNMRLHFDGALYSIGDKPMPLRARIMAELAKDPASGNELSDRLHVRKERVLAELKDMSREDLVESVSRRYQLTGKGKASTQPPIASRPAAPVPVTGSRPSLETPSGTGAGTGENGALAHPLPPGTGVELGWNRMGTDAGTGTGTSADISPSSARTGTGAGGYFTATYGEDDTTDEAA